MYNITGKKDLDAAILLIENEVEEQKALLSEDVSLIYESFRPVNVIKDLFKEVVSSEQLRSNILTAVVAISTGYLTKKIFFRKSKNPLKGILGYLFQYGVSNLVLNPSGFINTILASFKEFFDSKQNNEPVKKKKK
jgi:hypothetical protein